MSAPETPSSIAHEHHREEGRFSDTNETPPSSLGKRVRTNGVAEGSADARNVRTRLVERMDMWSGSVSVRKGPGNRNMHFVDHAETVRIANDIFGHNEWSSALMQKSIIAKMKDASGTWRVTAEATVRVTVLDTGAFREDIGLHTSIGHNYGDCVSNALKAAVSDARKRCLKLFGPALGLGLGSSSSPPNSTPQIQNKPPSPSFRRASS